MPQQTPAQSCALPPLDPDYHPTRATLPKHLRLDDKLRLAGFEIHRRPKTGDTLWWARERELINFLKGEHYFEEPIYLSQDTALKMATMWLTLRNRLQKDKKSA